MGSSIPPRLGTRGKGPKMANQVNIYKSKGEWCYALSIDGEFDSSDTVGCADDADETEVRKHLNDAFVFGANLTVTRVDDV